MIIMKNRTAQNEEKGSCRVADGYARNASPGPLLTTSSMDLFCSLAMKPRMEKMTKPAKNEVPELMPEMMMASLKCVCMFQSQ